MKKIELFRWWVTGPGGANQRLNRNGEYLTSFYMDAVSAQERFPGAWPEPTTRIERVVPDTEEHTQFDHEGYDGKPSRE